MGARTYFGNRNGFGSGGRHPAPETGQVRPPPDGALIEGLRFSFIKGDTIANFEIGPSLRKGPPFMHEAPCRGTAA